MEIRALEPCQTRNTIWFRESIFVLYPRDHKTTRLKPRIKPESCLVNSGISLWEPPGQISRVATTAHHQGFRPLLFTSTEISHFPHLMLKGKSTIPNFDSSESSNLFQNVEGFFISIFPHFTSFLFLPSHFIILLISIPCVSFSICARLRHTFLVWKSFVLNLTIIIQSEKFSVSYNFFFISLLWFFLILDEMVFVLFLQHFCGLYTWTTVEMTKKHHK